jgi:pimeloyl-ACP methyl ester carboxylesterase
MTLVLLPGLGADDRLFEAQKAAFTDLAVPPWIVPGRQEKLPNYAARMAETIAPRRPTILGGSSFGGMVAYEMASYLRPQAVVLIGSCRSPAAVRPMLRRTRALVPLIAVQAFALAKWAAPLGLRLFSPFTPQQRRLCAAMFKEADCGFLKWACRTVLDWQPSGPPPVPVFQIHGQKDPIMPARLVEADEVIPDGGHLISLTHPQQVNDFIQRAINSAT